MIENKNCSTENCIDVISEFEKILIKFKDELSKMGENSEIILTKAYRIKNISVNKVDIELKKKILLE